MERIDHDSMVVVAVAAAAGIVDAAAVAAAVDAIKHEIRINGFLELFGIFYNVKSPKKSYRH